MRVMIAFCGAVCTDCPAYIATMNEDDELRLQTAEEWNQEFNAHLYASDINCLGCISESGLKFEHCDKCEIRECAMERKLENCAHCDDYVCGKLKDFFELYPQAKITLNKIRLILEEGG